MKKSRYSLFVALALAAISTSACEDTVSLSVKCDGNQPFWTERNGNHITGGKCNEGVVGPIEFDVTLELSNGEKAIVRKKGDKCNEQRYILSETDDKRIVANACKKGDIECGYCCDNDRIAKYTDKANEAKTNSLCGDGSDENTSYQCQGTSVIVQKCKDGCVDGKCKGANIEGCENGTHQCNGAKIEICVDGDWKDAVGAQLCDGAKIWKCNDAGVAESQSCEYGAACKDGKCTDPVCDRITDSGLVCKEGKVGKCDSDKQWTELTGDVLCENDQILYCKNENEKPEPVGCYSEGDITSVCKQKDGKVVKDDSGCGNGMECNNFECKPKKYTCTAEDKYVCTNGGMLYDCNGVTSQEVAPVNDNNLMCEDSKVVWCKQENDTQTVNDKHTANITECSPNGSVKGCAEWCTTCDQNGNCAKCDKPLERCADDLKGKTVCSNSRNDATCNYCYNNDFENKWVDESKLGCGCVPNEYNIAADNKIEGDRSVCYKGKIHKLNHGKQEQEIDNKNFLLNDTSENKDDKVWEFALRTYVDDKKTKWEYYNCHNDAYEKASATTGNKTKFDCCEKGSFFIKQTGYMYYMIESCKSIDDTNSVVKAFQFDTALNDALIGKEENFLQKDSACLNVKNEDSSTSKDKPTILIKDTSIKVINDSAVYQAFKCPGGTVCNSSHKQLCMGSNEITTEQVYCESPVQDGQSRIMQLQDEKPTLVADCPNDTVLQIRDKEKQDWRVVETADCGTNKTHNLDDFRCYLGKSNGDKDSNS